MTTIWKDVSGNEWNARITIEAATRLRTEDGIDLLDKQTLEELTENPVYVVHVLTRVHANQCAEKQVTPELFQEVCTATESVAIAAADALTAALSDFLRRMRRPALAELVAAAADAAAQAEKQSSELMRTEGRQIVRDAVGKAVGTVRQAIDKTRAESPGLTSGVMPARSE